MNSIDDNGHDKKNNHDFIRRVPSLDATSGEETMSLHSTQSYSLSSVRSAPVVRGIMRIVGAEAIVVA